MFDVVKIAHAHPSWPLNRWISAMIALFKPQIAELLRARDRKVADWREQNPEADVFEDRDLEVASFLDISVEHQVREVATALLAVRQARSEEHTSELQSLMRISYAVFCLKKKKTQNTYHTISEYYIERTAIPINY